MQVVTIPPELGGTGTPYNDGTGPFGMQSNRGYGYNQHLLPMLSEVIAMANVLKGQVSGALLYTFDAETTDADPGTGKMRLNSATLSSVTTAYVDNAEKSGIDVSAVLDSLDNSTSSNKATLVLREGATGKVGVYYVTGTVVDGSGYRKLSLSWIGGSSGGFTDANDLGLWFAVTGDKGQKGDTGTSGNVAGDTHSATSKATPVDADELPVADSAASFALKKLTWANIKATLKTYFDTLYPTATTGSFTPALTGTVSSTGITYAFQVGRYVRIGAAVHVRIHIEVTSMGSASGAIQVTGLPFTSANVTRGYGTFDVRASNMTGLVGPLQSYNPNNSSSINLEELNAGVASALSVNRFTSTSIITLSGTYFV